MFDAPYTFPYSPELIPGPDEQAPGMWRWRRLLPLDGSDVFPLEVGQTPLIRSARLCEATDLPGLVVKDETRTPTGSNKDRATALCCADAILKGATAITAASSGNVAVSLSAGAAATGLSAYVFVSGRSVAPSKVALMRAYDATVFLVDAPYETAYRLSEAASARFGWYSRNTGENQLALQGKKTVAFEVWEQLGRRMPEIAYMPVGDGVTLAAFAHGCEELVRCGVADRLPKIIGVQATGSAPVARAFAAGHSDWTPVEAHTFADGVAVGDPFYGRQALEAVRRTGGEFVEVTDEQIAEAIALLARTAGLLAEPAGAASLAGALAHGLAEAAAASSVLVLASGTGFKDQRWLPSASGRALEVAPTVEALAEAAGL